MSHTYIIPLVDSGYVDIGRDTVAMHFWRQGLFNNSRTSLCIFCGREFHVRGIERMASLHL